MCLFSGGVGGGRRTSLFLLFHHDVVFLAWYIEPGRLRFKEKPQYKRNQLKSTKLTISNSCKVHWMWDELQHYEDQVQTSVAVQMTCDTTASDFLFASSDTQTLTLCHFIHPSGKEPIENIGSSSCWCWSGQYLLPWQTESWMTKKKNQFREQLFEHPVLNKGPEPAC